MGGEVGPGGCVGQVQDGAAGVAGDGGRDGEDPQPQALGLPPSGLLAGQGEHLHPGDDLGREGHDREPDLVLCEVVQRHGAQSGVLGGADAVLAARPATVAQLQVSELSTRPAGPGVGSDGGDTVSVDVGDAQLSTGVGTFFCGR